MALDLDLDRADSDPAAVLAQVRRADDDEIAEALAGDRRDAILRTVFGLMGEYLDPERAAEMEKTIHFKVWDRPDGGYDHYELAIADGACALSETPGSDPTVTIKGRAADLIRIAVGDANAVKLAFRGRLRVDGDLNFARKVQDLFRLPKT